MRASLTRLTSLTSLLALFAVLAMPSAPTFAVSPAATAASAPQEVQVQSLEQTGGRARTLAGWWFQAGGSGRSPAMLLLHGCGGNFDAQGRLAERYTELAARLVAAGVHALVLDSLTPRGERELCTQALADRRVKVSHRRLDALGALQWLAARPDVDAARLGVLGWSNGGSTVLATTNRRHRVVSGAAIVPTLAVAFYPGCRTEGEGGYDAVAPLLMLLGEADDWTPSAPCKALAAAARGARVEFESYPGAYHGFDGRAPVRLRKDVPEGERPGAGVHVGADPAAREASAARLARFLEAHWGVHIAYTTVAPQRP